MSTSRDGKSRQFEKWRLDFPNFDDTYLEKCSQFCGDILHLNIEYYDPFPFQISCEVDRFFAWFFPGGFPQMFRINVVNLSDRKLIHL